MTMRTVANLSIYGVQVYLDDAVLALYRGVLVLYSNVGGEMLPFSQCFGACDDAIKAIFAGIDEAKLSNLRGTIELRVPVSFTSMKAPASAVAARMEVSPAKRGGASQPARVAKPAKKAQPFTDQWLAEMGLTKKNKTSARKGK